MTTRLKKLLNTYKKVHNIHGGDKYLPELAEYFYKLALNDVKKELERMKKYAKESKMEWIDEDYNQNAFAEDCRIKSFNKLINHIKKLKNGTGESDDN